MSFCTGGSLFSKSAAEHSKAVHSFAELAAYVRNSELRAFVQNLKSMFGKPILIQGSKLDPDLMLIILQSSGTLDLREQLREFRNNNYLPHNWVVRFARTEPELSETPTF